MQRTFVVVSAVYILVAIGLESADVSHAQLLLLAAQYTAVLAIAARVLRGGTGPRAHDVAPVLVIASATVTAIAVLVIARYWDRGMLWGDESAYRAQAAMFASGRPWTDAPTPTGLPAELRFNHMVIHDGHWFAKYPPLWPAVLALGVLARVRWLVNPLLAAAALWILARLARREGVPARFVVLAAVVSPFFYMMAASQMSHVLGLVCCAGAVLAFSHGVRTARLSGYLTAALLLALCALVRPFTAACACVAIAPFYLRRRVPGAVAGALAIGAAGIGAVLAYQWLYTGHLTQSPYALYRGTALPVELSASPHVILGAFAHTARWAVQDTMMFTSPLVFALAGYTAYADRVRWQTRMYVWWFAVFLVADLFMTEGSSSRFGDRYLFEAWFAPLLLAARGTQLWVDRWQVSRARLNLVVGTLALVGAVQGALLVAPTLREIAPYVEVHDAIDRLPADGSLVFFPITDAFTGDRFDLNPPAWRSAPHMFLVDPGPARRDAVAHAEHRARWWVVGVRGGRAAIWACSDARCGAR